jgi:hypothetical protein
MTCHFLPTPKAAKTFPLRPASASDKAASLWRHASRWQIGGAVGTAKRANRTAIGHESGTQSTANRDPNQVRIECVKRGQRSLEHGTNRGVFLRYRPLIGRVKQRNDALVLLVLRVTDITDTCELHIFLLLR